MKDDILKPKKKKLTHINTIKSKIKFNNDPITTKKIKIDRPWSRWKVNRSSGTEFIYRNKNVINTSKYTGINQIFEKKNNNKVSLSDILRNKMQTDTDYKKS